MAEPQKKQRLSRWQFMRVGAATAGGAALAACQPRTVIVEREKVVRETVEQVVTREVTVEVTQEVVHEVTRVIEVKSSSARPLCRAGIASRRSTRP